MSDWDDWEDVFFDDEFDEEFETSRKIIIAVSSTIGAIVLLIFLGLCAFGCCGSYFAIRQLREYRERNRRPQQNAPAPTFHQSSTISVESILRKFSFRSFFQSLSSIQSWIFPIYTSLWTVSRERFYKL